MRGLIGVMVVLGSIYSSCANAWTYGDHDDGMGRGKIKTAIAYSGNSVNFRFPYNGAQNAMLIIKKHPVHGGGALLYLENAQFLCRLDDCAVSARFDNGKVVSYSASEPADYSKNYIYIDDYNGFVGMVKKSKKLRMEAEFYQDGSRVFEFDVAGLKW